MSVPFVSSEKRDYAIMLVDANGEFSSWAATGLTLQNAIHWVRGYMSKGSFGAYLPVISHREKE